MANPKAFISYSWTSPEHQKWVLDLATQLLRESGVDVTIDKWDLKEGHDAIKFMGQMVTDPDIKKVIMVLNRTYAEKANARKGGVGTEWGAWFVLAGITAAGLCLLAIAH